MVPGILKEKQRFMILSPQFIPAKNPKNDVNDQMEHPFMATVDKNGNGRDEDGKNTLNDLLRCPTTTAAFGTHK